MAAQRHMVQERTGKEIKEHYEKGIEHRSKNRYIQKKLLCSNLIVKKDLRYPYNRVLNSLRYQAKGTSSEKLNKKSVLATIVIQFGLKRKFEGIWQR